jgi:hypothetical protein
MSSYSYPPSDTEAAEKWAYDNGFDAVAYAAGWTQSGHGYGVEQAKAEWPECPGFDWEDGLPDWDCGLEEDYDYEYRTVLCYHVTKDPEVEGWEFVKRFQVTPEPRLHNEDGNECGFIYIGEESAEVVYRRKREDEDDA